MNSFLFLSAQHLCTGSCQAQCTTEQIPSSARGWTSSSSARAARGGKQSVGPFSQFRVDTHWDGAVKLNQAAQELHMVQLKSHSSVQGFWTQLQHQMKRHCSPNIRRNSWLQPSHLLDHQLISVAILHTRQCLTGLSFFFHRHPLQIGFASTFWGELTNTTYNKNL